MTDARSWSPDPDGLLAQTVHLRRLARAILADPNWAEDVVQDTYLAAIELGKEERAVSGAWLRSVVRNLSLRRRRSEQRRRRRERIAAERGGRQEEAEAREKADALACLTRAVSGLSGPYRSVIVLHYFDGLSVAGTARRLGVPVETVKTHLRRARQELREVLRKRLGDEQWESKLLWITPPGMAGAMTAVGGIVMGTGVKLGIVGVGTVVALVLVLRGEEPKAPRPSGASESPLEAAAGIDQKSSVDLSPNWEGMRSEVPGTATEPTPGASAQGSLKVRLVHEGTELPITGVSIRVQWEQEGGGRAGLENGVTGEDGSCRFLMPAPVQVGMVAAAPTATTPSVHAFSPVSVEPGEESEVRLVALAPGVLTGKVVDRERNPVPFARVNGWMVRGEIEWPTSPPHRVVAADKEGRFRMDGLANWILLTAETGDLAPCHAVRGALLSREHLDDLELVVEPRRVVHGRVVGEDGRPMPGIRVTVTVETRSSIGLAPILRDSTRMTYRHPVWALPTDEEGGFSFPVPASPRGTLQAFGSGFPAQTVRFRPGQDWYEIVLPEGFSLPVLVLDPEDHPVAKARIIMIGPDWSGWGTTDEAGRFSLDHLHPGEGLALLVHAPGLAIQVHGPMEVGPNMDPAVVRLAPGRALFGVVFDPDGNPVEGLAVEVEGDRTFEWTGRANTQLPTWESLMGVSQARTGPDGGFRVEDLYDGWFRLVVRWPGEREPLAIAHAASGSEEIRIVLGSGLGELAILRGRVVDLDSGLPLRSYRVSVFENFGGISAGTTPEIVENDQGCFETSFVHPDQVYELRVQASGYTLWNRPLHLDGPGVTEIEVALMPAVELQVRVVDQGGRPVPGAGLAVLDRGGETVWLAESRGHAQQIPTTVDGLATLIGLPRAEVEIRASSRSSGEARLQVDLRKPQPGVLEIKLRQRGED